MTFEEAKRRYTNRYTGEHKPAWARTQTEWMKRNGLRYAPPYATDREWFDNTLFPPHSGHKQDCLSQNPSWPMGEWLKDDAIKP